MTIETLNVIISAETEKLNKGLSETKKKLSDTSKSMKKTASGGSSEFKKLGKQFALTHIAVQLIMKAVQGLIKMFKQGINNAYQFSKATGGDLAKNLDGLKSSLSYLTNALGAALIPILNKIVPILTTIIDKVADFTNQIGETVAILTGNDEFVKAKKQAEEWGEGVEDAAQQAKKATMGFDELNIVDSGKDNKKESSNPVEAFEKVKVDKKNLLDIPKIFDKIKTSITSVTGTINKFFKETNWKEVGETLGGIFNGLIDSIDTLVTEIDWQTLGKSIMDGIFNFIGSINWTEVVNTIFDILMGALDLLTGLLLGIDWEKLFNSLFEIAGAIFDNIINGDVVNKLFETAGVLVGKVIEGIITYTKKKIEMWMDIFNIFKTFFQDHIDEAGGDIGQGILNAIGDALKGLGQWCLDKIVNPLLEGIAKGLGLKGGKNELLKIFENAWANVKIFFTNVGIFFENTWNDMWYGIKYGLISAVNFIIDGLNNFIRWIVDGWVGDFIEWVIGLWGGDTSGLKRARSGSLVSKIALPENSGHKAYQEYVAIMPEQTASVGGASGNNSSLILTPKAQKSMLMMAAGGIVNSATQAIIGENGKEAVVPLENNTEWIDMLAEKINAGTPSRITLNVDGKQLGYAVINNINNITKQTGSLQLSLA